MRHYLYWIPCLFAIALCPAGALAKGQKDLDTTNSPSQTEDSKPPLAYAIEKTIMQQLAGSIPKGGAVHWATQASDDGPLEVLMVKSDYRGREERGNMLILAKPGTYPYQARWYSSVSTTLIQRGWNVLSTGITPLPSRTDVPQRSTNTLTDEELQAEITEHQKANSQALEAWDDRAKNRGLLLLAFSNANLNTPDQILAGFGQSAYIAGLMAAEPNSQLSGLVLINFETPSNIVNTELDETLGGQGPILEIVTSSDPKIREGARRRYQIALGLGNSDYRLEFSPVHLSSTASWLGTQIHGWAMSHRKQE